MNVGPENLASFNAVVTGSVTAGNGSGVQLDDVPCGYAVIQADSSNTGIVYLGHASGTGTAGYRLDATSPPIVVPVTNLNLLFAQKVRYMAFK